jgi:prepilin-type N-terminal cleavage/methylation domain-containing protein
VKPRPTGRAAEAGVTLVEMLVVVAIVGLLVGVTMPSVSAGLDTLRLNAACESVAAFFNEALNRAERRQQIVEITVMPAERRLVMRSSEAGFERTLQLQPEVTIRSVLPPARERAEGAPRTFALLPGGAVPRFGIEIAGGRGTLRTISVDPITGIPEIRRPAQ